jgi:hypothetical protein
MSAPEITPQASALLPCPFCGSPAIELSQVEDDLVPHEAVLDAGSFEVAYLDG